MKQILTLCAALMLAGTAQAQSMSGLNIGDTTAAAAKTLGAPASSSQGIAFNQSKWTLANGNELIVNADGAGKILYVETGWNQKPESAQTGVYDFTFGKTTLADVRAKLNSGGLAFAKRPPLLQLPDGVVLVTSFEVGSVVMTFYGVVTGEDVAKGRAQAANGGFALFAKLDSVSITSPEFAKAQWGDPLYPTNYKKSDAK